MPIAPDDADSTPSAAALAPTAASERIQAIDAARGLALLGILLVNIQSFAEPFGKYLLPTPPDGATLTDVVAFYFVKVFCEGKFYPLFAVLFGFGLMMQASRAQQRGRSYWGPGLRRYVFLVVLGLLHALLLWYGDILFAYGIAGLFLLCLHRVSARAHAITGAVFLALGTLLMAAFSFFTTPGKPDAVGAAHTPTAMAAPAQPPTDPPPSDATPSEPAPDGSPDGASTVTANDERTDESAPPGDRADPVPAERVVGDGKVGGFASPVLDLLRLLEQQKVQDGPSDPLWIQKEREAYTSGRPIDRLLFNAFNWFMFLMVCVVGFGWSVGAMLLLGAVLFRARIFDEDRAPLQRRLLMLGLLVGLPAVILGVVAPYVLDPRPALALGVVASTIFGPMLSLAYLSAVALIVRAGVLRPVTAALANVGRLALTNYLTHTLVCSYLFYEWGMHLYDQTTRTQRLGIVAAIFAAQLILSTLYLKVFRMGPMEWIWRCVTYLRVPPRASATE